MEVIFCELPKRSVAQHCRIHISIAGRITRHRRQIQALKCRARKACARPTWLNKPTLQMIETASSPKLLAEKASEQDAVLTNNSGDSLETETQQIMTDFDIQPGEIDMLFINVGDGLPLQEQTIFIAEATAATSVSTEKLYSTVGICEPVSIVKGEASNLSPALTAEGIFVEKKLPWALQNYPEFSDYAERMSITEVLQQPKHGTLEIVSNQTINYTPNSTYKGNDKVVFLITLGEYKVKLIYFIKVIDVEIKPDNLEQIYLKYCPNPAQWLISTGTSDWNTWTVLKELSGVLGILTSPSPTSQVQQSGKQKA